MSLPAVSRIRKRSAASEPSYFASRLATLLPDPEPDQYAVALAELRHVDVCDWMERHFYVAAKVKDDGDDTPFGGENGDGSEVEASPIRLALHQKAILRYAFTRRHGRFPFSTVVYSTVKKSGKSTIAAALARWFAETQTRLGHIFCVGNDLRQARERSFTAAFESIALTPGFVRGKDVLPGRWQCLHTRLDCLSTGSKIEAISVDAAGEAGGHPALSIFTELWGFETEEAKRFWDEMAPVPTIPDSVRLVETYAGFDGESELLRALYDAGMTSRQLTNGELAQAVARDLEGERYGDFLHAFEETAGNPDAPVPVWVNEPGGLCVYWDSGIEARRMPWQRGAWGERYYRAEEATKHPKAFRRHHYNEWVGAESGFVPIEAWDACFDPDLPFLEPGDQTPCVLALDAASTGDHFGAVLVTRHPEPARCKTDVAIRAARAWRPEDFAGHRIDFATVMAWVRQVCQAYNIVQIAYDPHQLEGPMQELRRERITWCEQFPQGQDRLKADRRLYDLIMQRQLAHNLHDERRQAELRQHVVNANAKVQKDEDSKLRIVKKSQNRKIDLVVAASMGCHRALYLNL